MRYRCKEGHEFIYPAKKITGLDDEGQPSSMFVILGPQVAGADNVIETRVCPFCQSLEFDELPAVEKQVESAVQVEWPEVDAKLKEGYVIVDKFSKCATLFKYKTEAKEKTEQ